MLLLGLMFFQTWLFETATSVRLQRIEHVVGLKESWTKADTPPVNELEFLRSTSQCGSASGRFDSVRRRFLYCKVLTRQGQVAQLVERGPEKAGVGGSIPSLATINFNNLARLKKHLRISRANNTRTSVSEIASHVGSTRRACRCLITLRDAPANSRHAQPSFLDGSDLVLPLQRT